MENNKEVCPVCGEGVLETRQDHTYKFFVGRQKHAITGLEHSVCNVCGTSLCSADQTDRNAAKIEAYQNELPDYISPESIAALRARYNISQSVAATIFGGGLNAFSKYERGEVCPSSAAATLMVLALKSKEFFVALAQAKGVRIVSETKRPLEIVKVGALSLNWHSESHRVATHIKEVAESFSVHGISSLDTSSKFYVKEGVIRRECVYLKRKHAKRSRGAIAQSAPRYVGQTEFDKSSGKKWNTTFLH